MDERLKLNRSCKVEVSKTETVRTEHGDAAVGGRGGGGGRGMDSAKNENVLTLLNFCFRVHETKII
jgi:hypothetical protein